MSDTPAPDSPAPETPDAGGPAAEYKVLARKYRPASFADLLGQDALVRTLTNAIRLGRVAHAFIFTGVRGVGKTTAARILARALNCVGPDGGGGPTAEPCGACEFCTSIAADRNVDVIEMDAASRAGVADIRELIDGVRYKPVSARYKIYIIDEVHMLSQQAFDALLKTLEEPPEHVKFMFATTEIRKVPVTVLSRCQRFDLRRLDQDMLAAHLGAVADREGARIAAPAIALLARAADGSARDGLSLLDQVIAQLGADSEVTAEQVRGMLGLADRGQVLDLLDLVMKGDAKAALELTAAMYRDGADPAVVLGDLLDVTHWLTRLKVVPDAAEGAAVSEADRDRAGTMAEGLSMPALARAWQMLLKGVGEIQAAPQPLTALEMLLVRLAYAADLPAPAELVAALGKDAAAPPPAAGALPPTASAGAAETGSRKASPEGPGAAPAAGGTKGQPQAALAARIEPEAQAAPDPTARAPDPAPDSFQAVVELAAARREGVLHSHLLASVHLVRFEPGRIEFRPADNAPRDLANRLGKLLSEWTGARWVVTVSGEPGAPTLKEQAAAVEAARNRDAASDPLVRAVLDTFPGAAIEAVRDLPPAAGGDEGTADPAGAAEQTEARRREPE